MCERAFEGPIIDIYEGPEAQTSTMKKPLPEDFGLTNQQYNGAKERVDHFKKKSSKQLVFWGRLLSLGFILSILLIIIESKKHIKDQSLLVAAFPLIILVLSVLLHLIVDSRDEHRLREELSKPLYQKVRRYESALAWYKQTTEQYWKSLKGIAFETSLAKLYRNMGYSVHQTKGSGDEGIDLVLEKEGAKTIVQCKGHSKPIGVGASRDLYGAMMHFGAPSAILACPAGFTEGVMQFVRGKPIKLISTKELIEMAESICQKEQTNQSSTLTTNRRSEERVGAEV